METEPLELNPYRVRIKRVEFFEISIDASSQLMAEVKAGKKLQDGLLSASHSSVETEATSQ